MLYGIIQDVWHLVKKYDDAWLVDAAWERMGADVENLMEKYKGVPAGAQRLIQKMMFAVLDYFMEREE